jgi:manganese-dependent ADP-ribose/CDP-alcohol diphosphatase
VLRRAVQRWNGEKSVRFCINFGDIVDGFCPKDRSLSAVQAVVREFDGFRGGPAYHMLGNHCLYNLPRSELVSVLRMPSASPGRAYYDFSPWPGYRFVVLDAYDFSARAPWGGRATTRCPLRRGGSWRSGTRTTTRTARAGWRARTGGS